MEEAPSDLGTGAVFREHYGLVRSERAAAAVVYPRYTLGPGVRAVLSAVISLVIYRLTAPGPASQPVRNQPALRRWMRAYASALSTTASYEKIRDAATAGNDEKPAKTTVLRYRDILERLWIIEPIPAWGPARNELAQLSLSPKHQLADPALAARLRSATIDTLLSGVSAGPLAPRDGDHEIDLIVEGAEQRVLAIEVNLARTMTDGDVRHLLWLRDRIGPDLLDAVIVSTGPEAYRRRDGIAVVPAALLGP